MVGLSIVATACLKAPQINPPIPAQSAVRSRILAADGTELATLFTENRKPISIQDIPDHVKNAVIAAEDQRFWSHKGFDGKSIIRAAIANIAADDTVQGGSTITQQYVKNIYFPVDRPRTFKQKILETQIAAKLEKELSKEQILERYLNTVYFGNGAYGIEAAAEHYFRKTTRLLTLEDSALLAGLIRSPESDNPRRAPEAALARRNHVIDRMTNLKMISMNHATQTRIAPMGLTEPPVRQLVEPHFVEYAKQWVLRNPAFGSDESERAAFLYQRGIEIQTSLDPTLQRHARNAIAQILNRPGDPEASLVAIDPRNGKVVAMVGGRDFSRSQVNLALGRNGGGSGRQSGSAFKPFVLAAAFEDGMRPETTYLSSPPVIRVSKTEVWRPNNNEGRSGGYIPLRTAMTHSVNGVFARLGMDVGPGRVRAMARRLGVTADLGHRTLDNRVLAHPSISLGTEEVSVLDMASAYATLANYGTYIKPSPVMSIELQNEEQFDLRLEARRVLDSGIAWLVTDVLRDVVRSGTGTRAQLAFDRPVAGKTGTTQNYADAWFVGYTPDLAVAVWVGYPDGQIPMRNVHGIRVFGGTFPATIWKLFMDNALEERPVLDFSLPKDDLIKVTINPETGLLAGPYCPNGEEVEMLRQLAPTHTCPSPSPAPVAPVTQTATSTVTPEPSPTPVNETSPEPSPSPAPEAAPSPSP